MRYHKHEYEKSIRNTEIKRYIAGNETLGEIIDFIVGLSRVCAWGDVFPGL